MPQPHFGRMIPAMVTPFHSDGEIDLKRTEALTDRLIREGSDALVICGTTGESPTISHTQKIALFQSVLSAGAGRVPIIANVGNNCTSDTISFAKEASDLGVDGVMCVVPYYNKPPQRGLYEHFRAVARNIELPVIMYNIPSRCVVNMEAQTTLSLARDCSNIVAVKEASGDRDQIKAIIDEAPEGFEVYSGDDALTFEVMKLGGAGVISTIGNVAPDRMKQIVELCAQGKFDQAKDANEALMPLMKGLFETANPILVKEALKLLGFEVGGVRLPLINATEQQSRRLAALMREVGVLSSSHEDVGV